MTIEELIAYAEGELGGPEAARVEARLAGDPAAAAIVARYRLARSAVRADDGADPPPEAIARARAIYDPSHFASARPGPIERLGELLTRLIYDSRVAPAMVGLRGIASGFQLTYELGGEDAAAAVEVELQAEPMEGGRTWRLIGQVSGDEPPGSVRVALHRAGAAHPLREITPDERGVFILVTEPGTYDLRFHLSEATAVIPDLRIP